MTLAMPTLPAGPGHAGLRLVPTALSDAPALAALVAANQAHLQSYMPRLCTLASEAAALEHLQYVAECAARNEMLEWHLFAGDTLCGAVRLHQIESGNRKASIAYYLDAGHQGRGIAAAAVRALLGHAFGALHFNRIELRCASGNAASRGLAERLGFSREGLLKQAEFLNGAYADHEVYALLRSEFSAAAPAIP